MGQIKFKTFYTDLVEHYLRMAVRYRTVSKSSSQKWFDITKNWIETLSDEDKKLIMFVFDKKFFTTTEGLYCFSGKVEMLLARRRLLDLEKEFALKTGLISDDYEV